MNQTKNSDKGKKRKSDQQIKLKNQACKSGLGSAAFSDLHSSPSLELLLLGTEAMMTC